MSSNIWDHKEDHHLLKIREQIKLFDFYSAVVVAAVVVVEGEVEDVKPSIASGWCLCLLVCSIERGNRPTETE